MGEAAKPRHGGPGSLVAWRDYLDCFGGLNSTFEHTHIRHPIPPNAPTNHKDGEPKLAAAGKHSPRVELSVPIFTSTHESQADRHKVDREEVDRLRKRFMKLDKVNHPRKQYPAPLTC